MAPWLADSAVQPLVPLAVVAASAVGLGFFVWAMGRLGGRLANIGQKHPDALLARKLPVPLGVAAGLLAALAALDIVRAESDSLLLKRVDQLVASVFILATIWVVVRLVRLLLEKLGRRNERFQPATRVSNRLVSALLYAAAFLSVLHQYGISITPLLTGLGIAALAVGLALQDTMSNFFAGIWIQTEQPLSPGHYVKVEGQNVEGFVEKVGWRTTRIRVLAGNLVVLPNSKLAQAIVTDYTLPQPMMSVVMNFRLPFDVEPQRVMTILVEEAKEAAKVTPGLLADPAPFSNATPGIGEYGIGYSLIIKVREFTDQWNAQTAVTARVWARFHKEGIHIPYPTRLNLQTSGDAFAPKSMVRVPKAVERAPEGLDPMQKEALKAKAQIFHQQAQEARDDGRPPPPPVGGNPPPPKPPEARPEPAPPKSSPEPDKTGNQG